MGSIKKIKDMNNLFKNLKHCAAIVSLKRKIWRKYVEFSRLNIPETLLSFRPNSAGSYNARALLTIQAVEQTFPALSALAIKIGLRESQVENIDSGVYSAEENRAIDDLKNLLDASGSDKASAHNYHKLYARILKERDTIEALLEIGLGTNNPDVTSNMGESGRPGASLRSFRDFLPLANIYGADIDKRVLFTEERIKTFFVDQTDLGSFSNLDRMVPSEFDLIIDDGLHSPHANIITLTYALRKIKVGGWFVVEDIALEALSVWKVVAAIMPQSYEVHIFMATKTLVFAAQRLA